MQARFIFPLILLLLLAACAPDSATPENALPTQADATVLPAELSTFTPIPTTATPGAQNEELAIVRQEQAAETATPEPTEPFDPDIWQELPVIPTKLPPQTYQIYRQGQVDGRDPHAFSKVGDCNAVTPDFMGAYDLQPHHIKLGPYNNLRDTLDYFAGSFGRESLAAKVGLSAHSVMSPLFNDWKVCMPNETPLDCEFRVHNPAFVFISLGANDIGPYTDFETSLRRVIEQTINLGIVPILATKPDNFEGDHSINRTIAMLANEYGVPLWNFWAVIQPLKYHGMINESSVHLSYSEISSWVDFETPGNLDYGWTVRNLSALQMLDTVQALIEAHETAQN